METTITNQNHGSMKPMGLSRYRAEFGVEFKRLLVGDKYLSDEQFQTYLRNLMYKWARYERQVYPEDMQMLCDILIYKLDEN